MICPFKQDKYFLCNDDCELWIQDVAMCSFRALAQPAVEKIKLDQAIKRNQAMLSGPGPGIKL